ncbi:NUDIX domain-containing protein [Streptomyces cinnamoneus]|uniref:NUDIX domain-containing protein n=1 Tax=Streptomyces cinnamoneus TaxID=53446 RepID=A0A2G1XMA9_STRCJ|nr:NUDIX hydrolase [Streptomyces cinnamoneus]PHQ52353.1 NUDIX domain-containing protein [Streptomyces cinnamoneus]PPT11555.1 NUDIX hydrolase [Streptomyces cinnamoneus]
MANPWIPPEQYVKKLPMHVSFGCMFFTDAAGRVLQLRSSRPEHGQVWQWPGGNTDEVNESPFDTAVRECREETGIIFTGRPKVLAVFWQPVGKWPVAKLGFTFDGGQLTADALDRIQLDPDEHDEFAVKPLDEWAKIMETRDWERLAAVHHAQRTGTTAYLEARIDAL